MKRLKKMLSLFLVIGMMITMIPMQAGAASSNAAEISDYQVFLENLNVLEGYAADYAAENLGKDPVALTMKYIRTGEEAFSGGVWNVIAGNEDSKFASYVLSRQDAHNASNEGEKVNVTGLKNLGLMKISKDNIVDMGHVFAVLDASYHNNGKNVYGDVAGWAGDLVDLMVLADQEKVRGDLDEMIQQITDELLLSGGKGATFSQAEFFGDMDGYAIAMELLADDFAGGKLSDVLKAYYGKKPTDEKRADVFLKNRMDAVTARSDIRNAVFNAYIGNEMVASLENIQSFTQKDLSDLRKACCYAFADYLCMLAGDYVYWNENIYYSVQSSVKTTLAPGITYEKFTATSSDDKQMVYYLAVADVSNPYVDVCVNYKDNDPTKGWGMQTVRDQAHAAEQRHSNPNTEYYVPNYNVIVAVNGAGYNMTTGEPAGLLMMEGVEYQAPDGADHGGYGFFGILKDGSAIIGSTEDYYDLKAQGLLMEGIDNFGCTLVKDGEIAVKYTENHINARHTRTAVGITRTGKVVFMVLDGRQEPVSCGGSYGEIAQIMLDAGCVDAINLDGGGSSTFLAEMPGDNDLSLINVPSDHFERLVSSSMIVVSTMPNPNAIEQVELDSDYDYLTAGSKVQMTAQAFNAAGAVVEIPDNAEWVVSDESVATISDGGVLTGLKNGQIDVSLKVDGKVLGLKTLKVVTPTVVYFEKDSIGVVRGETATLPVAAQYEGKAVAIRANDISIKLSNGAGKVSGFEFRANADATAKSVVATVNLVSNTDVSDSMTIMLYDKGDAFFDFDNTTGGNRQLAWLRNVSNATTGDNLIYSVVDMSKSMTTEYTLAFDVADLQIPSGVQRDVFAQLGVTNKAGEGFLTQLADKVDSGSNITVKVRFDADLKVDISKLAIAGDLFTLRDAKVNQNTLTMVLGWKTQSAPLSGEGANTVSILSGITAEPQKNAAWDSQKRLTLANEIGMEYDIVLKSDALYTYANENPDKGIAAYENGFKGGRVAGACGTAQDGYTLVNSMKNGWAYENGGYAYYDNGNKFYGVKKVGEFYYDFGENGINPAQTKYSGVFQIDGLNHYAKNGVLKGGIYDIGGEKYYFHDNGAAYDGEMTIEEVKVKFDNGLLTDGYSGFIVKSDGKTYHYDKGQKSLGWVYLGEDLYHFNTETGVMTTGTHVIPDAEAKAKGAYYDFDENGKTLWGYFNGYGYYYWAGAPRRNSWVKSGADSDREAWYRTNTNGHFVTDGSGKETFDLELDGVKYKAVKIECDGVVYTFDNKNGKLLLGSMVLEDGKWYYYWAGQPVKDGWFQFEGKNYYAFDDGHLAVGAVTIDGDPYVFTPQGVQITEGIMINATQNKGDGTMNVKLVNADQDMSAARVAVWASKAGQASTLQWLDMSQVDATTWSVDITMCSFDVQERDTYELHVYGTVDGVDKLMTNTTVNDLAPAEHTYEHQYDYKCDTCDLERDVDMTRPMMDMYRMYDPNGFEHFYTGSVEERDMLVEAGWNYEGVGFTFPLTTGLPVYRLYDPVTGEHLYTMAEPVKTGAKYEGEGPFKGSDLYECEARIWLYEGIAFNSAFENEVPQYRLHNPNVTRGAYHFTASEEERDILIAAGWEYQGIGWYSMGMLQ